MKNMRLNTLLLSLFLLSANLFSQPLNDECFNAFSLIMQGDTCSNTESYDYTGSTNSGLIASCTDTFTNDIFFMTTALNREFMVDLTVPFQEGRLIVYESCGGNEVYCSEINSSSLMHTITGIDIGGSYIIRIASNPSAQQGIIDVCLWAFLPPINDDCVNSIGVPVHTSETYTTFSNTGANDETNGSAPCPSCASGCSEIVNDIWFNFDTPTSGEVILRANGVTNLVAELFDGCGGNSVACAQIFPVIINSLAGNYSLRMWSHANVAKGDINLSIVELTCPPAPNLFNTWIGPTIGNWHDSAQQWSLGRIPTSCDNVIIPSTNSVNVLAYRTASGYTIQVEEGAELNVDSNALLNIHVE